jgi:hypothetical protein
MNALTPGPSPKLGEGSKKIKSPLLPPFSPLGRRGWGMRVFLLSGSPSDQDLCTYFALTPNPSPKLGEGSKKNKQGLLPPFSPSGRRGRGMRGIKGMTPKSTLENNAS